MKMILFYNKSNFHYNNDYCGIHVCVLKRAFFYIFCFLININSPFINTLFTYIYIYDKLNERKGISENKITRDLKFF